VVLCKLDVLDELPEPVEVDPELAEDFELVAEVPFT
jgi:hypothetical protein